MYFKDKVIVITGASSGIGKACAIDFAAKGAKLVLAARQLEVIEQLATFLHSTYQSEVISVKTDVTVEDDCAELMKQTLVRFGKIDVLLNNAGISMRSLFKNLELKVIKQLMDVNFWGTVYCTKYAYNEILKSKGSIVGVSSIAGYRGLPGRTGYSASKFAMNGFMESIRTELLPSGVHVMVACPGFTASNIRVAALSDNGEAHGETSMEEAKMMTAEEVASRISDGIKKRKRTLIMTGQGKLTVWLNKLFPALTDGLVFKHFTKEKNPLIQIPK